MTMTHLALAFPVLPGKTDDDAKAIAAAFRADPRGFWESRDRHQITLERAYLQKTPMGSFVVAYTEYTDGHGLEDDLAGSGLEMDQQFLRLAKEVHGADLTAPPPGPAPETLAEWVDPDVPDRGRGMAFTVPVAPGQTEYGRTFTQEAWGTRADELAASRRALMQRAECVTLQPTPMGDVVNVYLEADDPWKRNAEFAASAREFDVWFRSELTKIFPPYVDFSVPIEGVEEIFDSETLPRPE
jgi:hypothetical protein